MIYTFLKDVISKKRKSEFQFLVDKNCWKGRGGKSSIIFNTYNHNYGESL